MCQGQTLTKKKKKKSDCENIPRTFIVTCNGGKQFIKSAIRTLPTCILAEFITSGQMNTSSILQTIRILPSEAGNIENMSENDFLKIISRVQSNKSKTKGAAEC